MLIIMGTSGGLGKNLLEISLLDSKNENWKLGDILSTTRTELDIENEESIQKFSKKIETLLKPNEEIKIINATGISLNGMLHKLDVEAFNKTLQVNLTSNFLILKHFQPLFKNHPRSSLLILSSVVGEIGQLGTIAYSSSKSALRGLCRVAAKELARFNTSINVIELGYFDAGMINQISSDQQTLIKQTIPMNRFGNSSELYQACQFALNCNYLTGTYIKLNGGII